MFLFAVASIGINLSLVLGLVLCVVCGIVCNHSSGMVSCHVIGLGCGLAFGLVRCRVIIVAVVSGDVNLFQTLCWLRVLCCVWT